MVIHNKECQIIILVIFMLVLEVTINFKAALYLSYLLAIYRKCIYINIHKFIPLFIGSPSE